MPRRLALIAAVALAGVAPRVAAQPTPRVPSRTPGVFESRGTAPRVSLPDIERQPLSGFGPPPRTWVVPAERTPATAPFAPDPDGLPQLVLDAPQAPDTRLPRARTLRLEGGGGAQYARYGRLDLDATGQAGRFFVDADYDGLDRRDRLDYVPSDRVRVAAGGQSFAPGRLRLVANVDFDTYRPVAATERRRLADGGAAGVEGLGAVPYRARLGYTQSRLSDDGAAIATEGRLDGEAEIAVARGLVEIDAAGGLAGTSGGLGSDVTYASGGLALALGRADGARATLGVRAMTYDATATARGGDARAFAPIVDVTLPLGPAVRLFVANRPRLAVRSLASMTEQNPYVQPAPTVAPDVLVADAQAGLELSRGVFRLRAYATGLYAPTYLTYESPGGGALFTETYVDARAYGVGGDVAVGTPDRASATAGVEVRYGETAEGFDLALFAPLVARAGVHVPVARGRGRVGLSAYAEAPRPDGLGGTADAWGSVSFDAHYDVGGPLSVVLRADRLVGTAERWPGFPEAPFAVQLGLRLSR